MNYAGEIVLFNLVDILRCTVGIQTAWTRGTSPWEVYLHADRSRHNLFREEFLTGPSLLEGVVEGKAMPTEIQAVEERPMAATFGSDVRGN